MSKLVLNDVNIYYGDFHAVQNVNMQIPAKSVTAFIGPSGCGKSTFLRTLNRMHEVIPGAYTTGKVLIDGEDVTTMNGDELRRRDRAVAVEGAGAADADGLHVAVSVFGYPAIAAFRRLRSRPGMKRCANLACRPALPTIYSRSRPCAACTGSGPSRASRPPTPPSTSTRRSRATACRRRSPWSR